MREILEQRVVPVAFELQHRVDDVLEHAGPGERALLRDVPHEQDRDPPLLRQPHERMRALAHLTDAAGR